ncbi:hypothetical protein [Larkinella soli]|uniref:hypothetical protein n=1 Tax=Larkinella soli TaxID=1770527 RepID=UPI000FFC4325|nr:hypothetical protein [Larkinella soli]
MIDILIQVSLISAAIGAYLICATTQGLPKRVSVPMIGVAGSFFFTWLAWRFVPGLLNLTTFLVSSFAAVTAFSWLWYTYWQPMPKEKRADLNRRLLWWFVPAFALILILLLFERESTKKYLQPMTQTVPTSLAGSEPTDREKVLEAKLDSARRLLKTQ